MNLWKEAHAPDSVQCWFDGAASPNPGGRGGYGVVVKRNGRTIFKDFGFFGQGPEISNNAAEYAGVIVAMRYLFASRIKSATIFGDSNLVIRQMSRRGKASRGLYIPYYLTARELRDRLPEVKFKWIPREENFEADELSNLGISSRIIKPVLTRSFDQLFV